MRTMRRSKYPTDLSDTEWECLNAHLPAREKRSRGRPRLHSPRQILDAVFYVLRSGCPWRLLPGDFPPWRTVYHWFRRWRIEGTFERLNAALRESLRVRSGRNPKPSLPFRRGSLHPGPSYVPSFREIGMPEAQFPRRTLLEAV